MVERAGHDACALASGKRQVVLFAESLHQNEIGALTFDDKRLDILETSLLTAIGKLTMAKKRSAAAMEDDTPADDGVLETYKFAFEDGDGVYQCQMCKMIHQDLRAEGSVSEERPSVSFCKKHNAICRADVFDLTYIASLMKEFIATETGLNNSIVVQPRFKAIIREMVGDDEELVEVFTHGVEAVMRKKSDADFATPGLYKGLPAEVSYDNVSKAFDSFIVTTSDLFGTLAEHELFLRFLQCINPSLQVPQSVLDAIEAEDAKIPAVASAQSEDDD